MKRDLLDRLLFFGLIITLLWSPLPFGSVESWSGALLEIAAFILLILWSLQLARGNILSINRNPLQIPIIGLLALVAIQLLPLSSHGAISLDAYSTRQAGLMLLALAILFFLLLNLLDGARLRLLAHIFILWGGAIALFGIVQSLAGNGRLYWFKVLTNGGYSFGPFVNRNHFAGFMEMLAPMPIAILLVGGMKRNYKFLYGFIAALMSASVLMSASRAGLVSLFCEYFFLMLFVMVNKRRMERRIAMAVLVIIIISALGALSWFGSDTLLARLNETGAQMEAAQPLGRVAIWRSSLRMAREHPLLGVGMDAFEAAYTRYDGSAGMYRIEQAHNDYLQLLTDFGIAGALLGLLFIGIFFVRAFRALGDANKYLVLARNVSYGEQVTHRAQILGALTGCVGMLIHSCFDFNLHIPSNALLFLCLAAIATSENFAN